MLDLGSGRGFDAGYYGMAQWDPHWALEEPDGLFDTVTCVYVLNILPPDMWQRVVTQVREKLAPGGRGYIAVRRDLKKPVQAGRGCTQRKVFLSGLESIVDNGKFAVYEVV